MNKSSIYIIIPHSERFLTSERVFPSLGAQAIKAFLELHNHKCWIDDEWDDKKLDSLEEYDFIGFSTTTAQWRANGKYIAQMIKNKYPLKKIIVGGAAATYHHDELDLDSNIDYIIKEAGEKPIVDILDDVLNERIINYGKLNVKEFNELPLPWRSWDYLSKYNYKIKERRATSAVVGLYCPY